MPCLYSHAIGFLNCMTFLIHTGCDQKISRNFQILWVIFRFSYFFFFFALGYYICWQYQPFWIVGLFLTGKTVRRVLLCSSIFYYSKKWIKECVQVRALLWSSIFYYSKNWIKETVKGSPSNVFFSTIAYFVYGNTYLMSDLF